MFYSKINLNYSNIYINCKVHLFEYALLCIYCKEMLNDFLPVLVSKFNH